MRGFLLLLLLIGVIGLGSTALAPVDETQYAIITRFGHPQKVVRDAGLQLKWPAPMERAVYLDKRLLVLDLPGPGEPAKEFLTLDKKNVEVSSYTAWRIQDPLRFLQNVGRREDADAILADTVISEIGKTLGQHNLSALLSTEPAEFRLDELTAQIRTACAARSGDHYGIEIVDFRIKRVTFPDQNRTSVFQRMRAERKRIATRYRSEGEQEATRIRAEAKRKSDELIADARRQAEELRGQAEADAARIYAEAYGRDPEFYEFVRTLESFTRSLTRGTTLLLPAEHAYLRLLNPGAPTLRSAEPADDAASEPHAAEEAAHGG